MRMTRYGIGWLMLVGLAFALGTGAMAQDGAGTRGRQALVIGVDRYDGLPEPRQLHVAVRDARMIAEALRKSNPSFQVTILENKTRREVDEALDAFAETARDAECALVYFAGHGVEFHGENYLLLRDTKLERVSLDVNRAKRQVGDVTLGVSTVLDDLEATGARVKLVILDACRDNPLEVEVVDGAGTRSRTAVGTAAGLGSVSAPSGMLVSYAADAGQQANDGLFTPVLCKHLVKPGLDILRVFAETREEVRRTSREWFEAGTGVYHEPAEYTKLNPEGTRFTFVPGTPEPDRAAELAAMQATKDGEIERLKRELAMARTQPAMPAVVVPPVPAPAPLPVPAPASIGVARTRAGETRTIGGIEMVWCPPGTFLMGSAEGEADRSDDETQHEVTLTEGFWLAKTECTQAQWSAVMGSKPSNFPGDDLPVETVSWDDAVEWCQKMNTAGRDLPPGMKWTLPTEAQWEYACRAGTTTPFSFGTRLNGREANCDGNFPYGTSEKGPYLEKTSEVGSYAANAWGFSDMHGNVWEWCGDWYGETHYTSSAAKRDPQGPATGSYRVSRGGSWFDDAQYCRSAYRYRFTPDYRFEFLGFRPAVSLP